jgi:hypothetical protein
LAKKQANYTPNINGGKTTDVIEFQIADEPAWVFRSPTADPNSITLPGASDPNFKDAYQKYLTGKLAMMGQTVPSSTEWQGVLHEMSALTSGFKSTRGLNLEHRRLFYWGDRNAPR